MPWTGPETVVVLTAHQFNPTAISQIWLDRHHIVLEGEFLDGSIFSAHVVQVRTARLHMVVVPPQLQFAPLVPQDEQQALIVEKLGTLVRELPHTPYQGMGLNLIWQLSLDADQTIETLTRELFFVPDRPVFSQFGGPDAKYGMYVSKDFPGGFRLKLDIKPIRIETDPGEHRLQFAFNFHHDLTDLPAEEIAALLGHWDQARAEAERIIHAVEPRQPA